MVGREKGFPETWRFEAEKIYVKILPSSLKLTASGAGHAGRFQNPYSSRVSHFVLWYTPLKV